VIYLSLVEISYTNKYSLTKNWRALNDALSVVWCPLFIFPLRGDDGMNQSFNDQLMHWKKDNMPALSRSNDTEKKPVTKQQQPEKKKEKLSDSDLKYLMGTGRPTYHRHKGALRQK
jgi:hypothetical protein